MAGSVRAASGLMPGCRGRSPRQNKLIVSPFPGGEGGRGNGGQKSKLKAGATGNQEGKPPPGAWFAPFPSAARVQARGCKGRSPLHKITLVSPFPGGEGGRGGWGQKKGEGRGGRRQARQAPLQISEWHGHPATIRASPLPAKQKTPPHSGTPCGAPPQGG